VRERRREGRKGYATENAGSRAFVNAEIKATLVEWNAINMNAVKRVRGLRGRMREIKDKK
jgi:hypothetical protein